MMPKVLIEDWDSDDQNFEKFQRIKKQNSTSSDVVEYDKNSRQHIIVARKLKEQRWEEFRDVSGTRQ